MDIAIVEYNGLHSTSLFCNSTSTSAPVKLGLCLLASTSTSAPVKLGLCLLASTSTSAPVKLGLCLLAGAPPVLAFCFDMTLILLVDSVCTRLCGCMPL